MKNHRYISKLWSCFIGNRNPCFCNKNKNSTTAINIRTQQITLIKYQNYHFSMLRVLQISHNLWSFTMMWWWLSNNFFFMFSTYLPITYLLKHTSMLFFFLNKFSLHISCNSHSASNRINTCDLHAFKCTDI